MLVNLQPLVENKVEIYNWRRRYKRLDFELKKYLFFSIKISLKRTAKQGIVPLCQEISKIVSHNHQLEAKASSFEEKYEIASEKLKNSKPKQKMRDFVCQTIQEMSIQTVYVANYESTGTNTNLVGEGEISISWIKTNKFFIIIKYNFQ